MKYNFKIKKETDGYSAECVELSVFTQGDTMDELNKNMQEALNLHLSESEDSSVIFKLPQKPKKGCVQVEVDPSVAVALVIRQARIKRKMSQRQMQTLLGFKNLSNYQRLEDPKKANPELKTLYNIFKSIPELDFSLLFNH